MQIRLLARLGKMQELLNCSIKFYSRIQKRVKGLRGYRVSGDDHVPYFTMCQKFKRIPKETLKFGKCPRVCSPDDRDVAILTNRISIQSANCTNQDVLNAAFEKNISQMILFSYKCVKKKQENKYNKSGIGSINIWTFENGWWTQKIKTTLVDNQYLFW